MRITMQNLTFGASCLLAVSLVSAQSYPTKPVRIMLPFGAGGVADITARVTAQKMTEGLGQQVLIDNRPSAGGIVAADAVAKSDPDGYTLFLLSNGAAVSASLFKSLPYDTMTSFAPISTLGFFGLVLLASPDSNISSIKDFLAFAKANPGKANIATINVGSTQNLAGELFRSMSGADATMIPFKDTPSVIQALRSNQVHLAFEFLTPTMGQIKTNAIKPLAVTSATRFPGLPAVPTVAESGIAGYEAASWNGFAAPAKTPRPIIERLNREVRTALGATEVREKLAALGVEAKPSTPEELQKLLASEIAKWAAVIERAKIPKQ